MVFGAAMWLVLWGIVIHLVARATRRWSGVLQGSTGIALQEPT